MSQSLLAKLDELQEKVTQLAGALEQARYEASQNKESLNQLSKENEKLKKKVTQAQGQVNQMINQWFPELDLNTENSIGSA